jgi:nucleotide-binding universal stress UspA family protein
LQAKLHFVHVIPDTPIPLGDPVGAYTAFDYAGLSKSLKEAGHLALEKALQTTQELQPTRTILHANTEQIHALIAQTAKDVHSDLILMTTHARSGFDRLLLGSVAQAVVHHASVPVLLLRPKAVPETKAQKALSKTS